LYKEPKFSIIIPTYNVEKYLSYCLETVIGQTLKDIEIICVNDGSTDNSLTILQRFQGADDRIRIIDKENGGLSSARNAGLEVAKGKYIIFLDSDDYLCTDACDRIYSEFIQTNADIVVYGSNIFPWHKASENTWLSNQLNVHTNYYKNSTIKSLFYENGANPFVWNKCFRREFLVRNGFRFDEDLLYGEDTPFLFCVFPAATEISFIEDRLYNYRCSRQESLMSKARQNPKWKMEMHLKIVEKILECWKEKSYILDAMDEIHLWILEFFVYDLENEDIAQDDKKEIVNKIINMIAMFDLSFVNKDKMKYGKKMEKRLLDAAR